MKHYFGHMMSSETEWVSIGYQKEKGFSVGIDAYMTNL